MCSVPILSVCFSLCLALRCCPVRFHQPSPSIREFYGYYQQPDPWTALCFSKTQLDRGVQCPSVPWIMGSFATNSLDGHPMIVAYDPSLQFMSLSSHVRSTVFQWICSIPASENLFHGSGLCFWTIYGDTIIIWDVLP